MRARSCIASTFVPLPSRPTEQVQVFCGPGRTDDFQGDTIFFQDRAVCFAKFVISAVGRAGGDGDVARRGRCNKLKGDNKPKKRNEGSGAD